ncbi:MAG TPA: class I SAM-dependent methyltransferase [Streptosporangiaceae bacterium]|nr:class I SAM-dependent methyltransferase [Streptosporangiaceae bacterium]
MRGQTWQRRRRLAAGYDSAVHAGPVVRVGARLLWGYDVSRAWAEIGEVAHAAPGSTVLDLPSGGGIALRGLRPGQRIRYVAADISPVMLARVRARARMQVRARAGARRRKRSGGPRSARELGLVQASIAALPFPDRTFDLCLSYNGLHCFPEPAAAVQEYARILRPGGVLRGTTIIAGTGRWHDAVTWALRQVGAFGRPFQLGELAAWLRAAGFDSVRITRCGAVATFAAHRASPEAGAIDPERLR